MTRTLPQAAAACAANALPLSSFSTLTASAPSRKCPSPSVADVVGSAGRRGNKRLNRIGVRKFDFFSQPERQVQLAHNVKA